MQSIFVLKQIKHFVFASFEIEYIEESSHMDASILNMTLTLSLLQDRLSDFV